MNNAVKRFFTPTVVVTMIGWIILLVFFAAGLNAHVSSQDIHMTYEKKVERFVTRAEFVLMLDELSNIRAELQDINRYLRILNK